MKTKFLILLMVCGAVLAACSRNRPRQPDEPPSSTPAAFSPETVALGEESAYTFQSSGGEALKYLIYFPENYVATEEWPFILFLHGSGAKGADIEILRGRTLLRWIDEDMDFPFIVLSPQIPSGYWPQIFEPLDELMDFLTLSLPIDEDALFLTGNSLGGHGSWHYALEDPERFAAVAIVSGGPAIDELGTLPEDFCDLKELPIWVFHGDADNIVPIEKNVNAVEALEACGSNSLSFTIYEGGGHAAASRITYSDAALYEWLQGHSE
jgi:predicted peptidase